jgi:ankyrin repeat protein
MRCGDTCPLIETARKGHLAATKILLAAGADINTEIGHTCALVEATRGGHIEVMITLLQAGASTKTTFQWSHPLSVASMLGNLEAMKILIDAGADVSPHAMGEDLPLPLWEATKNNHVDAVLLLVEFLSGTTASEVPFAGLQYKLRNHADRQYKDVRERTRSSIVRDLVIGILMGYESFKSSGEQWITFPFETDGK